MRESFSLSGGERLAHLRAAARRLVRRQTPIPTSLQAGHSILFVCYGNIIRSALAEALLRRHAAGHEVPWGQIRSAGVAAKGGRSADPRAVAAATALGVDLTLHRAQPLSPELIAGADAIFVMDRLNEAQLLARFPEASGKVFRLGAVTEADGSDVIADPYTGSEADVAAVASRIDRATQSLASELARRAGTNAPRARA